jgi:hypothetical protein
VAKRAAEARVKINKGKKIGDDEERCGRRATAGAAGAAQLSKRSPTARSLIKMFGRARSAPSFWTMTNFDPAEMLTLASTDVVLAYAISPVAQLDMAANFGLTKHQAGMDIYAGISLRF